MMYVLFLIISLAILFALFWLVALACLIIDKYEDEEDKIER